MLLPLPEGPTSSVISPLYTSKFRLCRISVLSSLSRSCGKVLGADDGFHRDVVVHMALEDGCGIGITELANCDRRGNGAGADG